jgi:ABC-type transporter Mla MlaB component
VLRITCVASDDEPRTVKVEGRIAGEYVLELSRVARAAMANSSRIALDLSQVEFVDHGGVALLRSLRDRGVIFVDCSSFISSLVDGGTE